MLLIWLGALVTVVGLLDIVRQTIWHGPLSGPVRSRRSETLEPRTGGFASAKYWPGLIFIFFGVALTLVGAIYLNPEPALVR